MSIFQKSFLNVASGYENRIYLFIKPIGSGVLVSHVLMLQMLVKIIPMNNYPVPILGKTNKFKYIFIKFISLFQKFVFNITISFPQLTFDNQLQK